MVQMKHGYKVFAVLIMLIAVGLAFGCAGDGENQASQPEGELGGVYAYVEQDEYRVGDTVRFGVANNGNESVEFRNGAPWVVEKKEDDGWVRVEEHVATMALWKLEPGESKEWTWTAETQDQEGLPEVTAGEYRVVVSSEVGEHVAGFTLTQ